MKRLITLFMLIVVGCGGDDSVDPIVNMYPFLIDSTPCKGSILMPAENVAIQQGEEQGPFDSDSFIHACFIVTTAGPSKISLETDPPTKTEISFVAPELKVYNSAYQVDPVANVAVVLDSALIQIATEYRFSFRIVVN